MNNGYTNTFGLNTLPQTLRGNQQMLGGNNQLISGGQYYSAGGVQQPYYSQPVTFGQSQQNANSIPSTESNTNIIWMQGGENTVKSTMMPNSTQYVFFSQEGNNFYIKTVDQYGKSSVESYVYFLESELPQVLKQDQQADSQSETPVLDTSIYVTKEQLEETSGQLTQQIQDVVKKINDLKSRIGNMYKKENK